MSRMSGKKSWAAWCCLACLLATPTITLADPATTTASAEHLTAKVTAVDGLVQYRATADDEWKKCEVGLELNEGAEFRTGPRSSVTFVIPPKQTITLDRLGVIKLLEAVQQKGKYTTDMGMKYGRTRYDIEAPGVEHESTVRSPNGTLAVRDTSFAVQDERPFPPEAFRLSGTVDFSTAKRTISIGGAIPGNVKAVGDQNPADTSLTAAVVDPSASLARTPAEASLVAGVLSRGAVFSATPSKQIPIISGGTPPTQSEIQKNLPGNLSFVLTWNGNANLDLRVDAQKTGEVLYPQVPLNRSPSGGFIPFNDIGGPQGGVEFAFWKNKFPIGNYAVLVNDLSGSPVTFTAEVFDHGTLVPFQTTDFVQDTPTQTFTGTISAGQVLIGRLPVGGGLPPVMPLANQAKPIVPQVSAKPSALVVRSRR